MNKREIKTDKAPEAVGPYSQALKYGDLIFVSGQIPIETETGQMVAGNIQQSVKVIFKNINEILRSDGSSLDNIIKVSIFLRDMGLFLDINEEYARHFKKPYPAREVIEVSALPKNADIEISVIAHK